MIDQGQRNAAQGVLGRQLGLTKVVNIKQKLVQLQKNIEKEINAVQAEVKIKEPSSAPASENQDEAELQKARAKEDQAIQLEEKNQEKEFTALEGEIKLVGKMIPKIEKLEQELELLDANGEDKGKDPELADIT